MHQPSAADRGKHIAYLCLQKSAALGVKSDYCLTQAPMGGDSFSKRAGKQAVLLGKG